MNVVGTDDNGWLLFECDHGGEVVMKRIDPEIICAFSEEVLVDGVLAIDTDE
jgi:hypothetical protein